MSGRGPLPAIVALCHDRAGGRGGGGGAKVAQWRPSAPMLHSTDVGLSSDFAETNLKHCECTSECSEMMGDYTARELVDCWETLPIGCHGRWGRGGRR